MMFKVLRASSILAATLMTAGALPALAQMESQNGISEFNQQLQSTLPMTINPEQSEIMMRGGPGGGGHVGGGFHGGGRPGPGGPGGGGHPGGGFPGGGHPGPGPGGGWHPGPGGFPGGGRPGPGPGGGWHPGQGGGGWHPGPRPGPGWPVPGPTGFYQCSAQNGYGQGYYATAYDAGTAQQLAMNQCYQFSNFNCFPTGCVWR